MHHILKLPFTIHGTVIKHLGRGRDLGYPTANFPVTPETPEGIFVGYTKFDNRNLPALIFIGAPITFDESDKKAEIYILDFQEDIYDKELEVIVEQKIRDNMKFPSQEELIARMDQDQVEARNYFINKNND